MFLLAAAGVLVSLDPPAPDGTLEIVWKYVVPMGIFLGVFWLFLWRPQSEQQKTTSDMLAALAKGDKVVTSGGLHGKVAEVQADTILLEVSEKTRVVIDKSAVAKKLAPDA